MLLNLLAIPKVPQNSIMSPIFFLSVLWQIQCNICTDTLEMAFSLGA